jgi:hypothetical protein
MSSSDMSLLEREAKAPKLTTNRYQAVMLTLARGANRRYGRDLALSTAATNVLPRRI